MSDRRRKIRRDAAMTAFVIAAAACVARGAEPAKKLVGKDVPVVKLEGERQHKVPPATRTSAEVLRYQSLSVNLVKNGSFERGRYWPYAWEPTDGLCCFWEEGGTDGRRCIRHFTQVDNEQSVQWNSKVRALVDALSKKTKGKPQSVARNPLPRPPKPKLSKPPYYDSVGGLEGVIYLCDPIPHRTGGIYRVTLDARTEGGGAPIVFVKGYVRYKGRVRNCGRFQFTLSGIGKDWKRFSGVFHPVRWKSKFGNFAVRPEFLKIQLYSYWTVGNYWYDNVKLEIVGWERYEPFANPKDLEKLRPKKEEKPGKADSDLKEGEFPVF
jgi:hypothetical protein